MINKGIINTTLNGTLVKNLIYLLLPMTVDECIKSQSIRPTAGEIENVDLWVIAS